MLKHLFEVVASGYQITKSFSLGKISERYRNTQMSPLDNGNFLFTITKRITHPIEISIEEAKIEAFNLVDRLILIDNHHIRSITYKGYEDENGNLVVSKKNNELHSSLSVSREDPLAYYCQKENKRLLNKKDNLGVLRTFRIALDIKDKISQYLIFYGLLYILTGEVQKKVDLHIKSEHSDILVVQGYNGEETIITNIRNKIAQPANDIDMEKLSESVDRYLETLKKIVINKLRKED